MTAPRAPRFRPLTPVLPFSLAFGLLGFGCGGDGGSADSLGSGLPLDDGGTFDSGIETGGGSNPTATGGASNTDGGGSQSGGSNPTTAGDNGSDAGETGEEPPRTCDYAVGCYNASDPVDSSVGVNSRVQAGCEGGNFRPTASIALNGMETGGIGGIDAMRTMPVLADMTGDGVLDVLLNPRKMTSFIIPGDGSGDFPFAQDTIIQLQTPGAFAGGWGPDAGDIDGDGDLDAATGDHGWCAAAWINGGNGNFTLVETGLRDDCSCSGVGCGRNHNGGGLGNVTGDSNLEFLLGGDQFAGTHVNLFSFGGSAWTNTNAAPAISGSAGHIQFADMDNDGDNDVFAFAAAGPTGTQVQVFKNNGGSFSSAGAYDSANPGGGGADPRQGSVGDVNCDGFVDIAAGGRIWLNQGGNSFSDGVTVNPAKIAHLADMNGDGALDLVTSSVAEGLSLYYNDGSGTNFVEEEDGLPDETYQQYGGPVSTAYGMDIGDVDGNGNLDIIRVVGIGNSWVLEAWSR